MKRLFLILFTVLVVVGASGVVSAQAKGNVYSNKFVGLDFSLPEDWYVATDNETKELMPDAARVMGLDSPTAKSYSVRMWLDLGMDRQIPTMWGTASGSGSDSAVHLFSPDHAAIRRGQRGTLQLEHTPQVLLRVIGG